MLESLFKGIFDTSSTQVISIGDFVICVAFSLLLGLILAIGYTIKSRYTKTFVVTLALLPAVVCVIIMMVNGNVGTGVAVAGAFSLVRFRSAPGSAKEIGALFIAMGSGLIAGMGYLGYSLLFTLILTGVFIIYNLIDLGEKRSFLIHKSLRVTMPEDLDYTNVLSDIFEEYTKEYQLVRVKTVNMGSMYRLTYDITLKDATKEKEFIDKIRCRNGNLEISVSVRENISEL